MAVVKLDMSGFEQIEKTLKGKYATRVGILGSKASEEHNNTTKTNAEIGAIHELGLVAGIPQRSFLKMPLEAKLFNVIESHKDDYYNALKNNKMKEWFKAVGLWSEKIIDEAVTSSGFGTWEKNSPETIQRKHSSKPLIDTGQLRSSITSTVINK